MSTSTDELAGSSDLPNMADRLCVVCCEKSDGAHFGADTCRACAAFFRRAVVSGRKYYCNQGEAARCMCRKCRMEKCYAVGMKRDMVQGRRDPIVPKKKPHGCNEENRTPGSHISPLVWLPMDTEPKLLKRIISNYGHLRLKRKAMEESMYPELAVHYHEKGLLTGFVQGTSGRLNSVTQAYSPMWMEFALSSFDHFAALEKEKQLKLFSSFATLVWPMDKVYLTYRNIPKDLYWTYSIVSERMYFDINNIEYWVTDCPQSCEPVKKELMKVMKNSMNRSRQQQIILMEEMKIDEEEYAALLGLMLWNQNFQDGNTAMELLIKSMRDLIFRQLEAYYKSTDIPSYAERLGALMSIHGTVLVDVYRMKEDMELYNLMGALKTDHVMWESLKNL